MAPRKPVKGPSPIRKPRQPAGNNASSGMGGFVHKVMRNKRLRPQRG